MGMLIDPDARHPAVLAKGPAQSVTLADAADAPRWAPNVGVYS